LIPGDELRVERAVHEALMRMRGEDRQAVARSMIDPVVLYILAATSKRCLTVSELSPIVNLPAATCYKMIYQMERQGLVAHCGSGRGGGRGKAASYTSVLKEMRLDVRGSVIRLEVSWKNGTVDHFSRDLVPLDPEGLRSVPSAPLPIGVEKGRAATSD
jgi:hypothetical protein